MAKQKRAFNPKSLRNLPQYRDLSDEEFEDIISNREEEIEDSSIELKERVAEKIEELTRDYDLSDMKSNDIIMLEALATSMVALDDFESIAYETRTDISFNNIGLIEKLQRIASDLRSDISRQQTDLKISRKVRKGEGQEDVIQTVQELKDKAQQFYRQKMAYIICPKCDMLLATIWVQYPEVDNEFTFVCNRRKGGREPEVLCNHKFTVTSRELWSQKQVSNKPEVLPESLT